MSAGKGDTPRPVDGDRYRANYDDIFGVRLTREEIESYRDEAREWQNVKVTKNGETHCLGTLVELLERERDEARAIVESYRDAACRESCRDKEAADRIGGNPWSNW